MIEQQCKKNIVSAWDYLVRRNNVDKITIKDITNRCQISRQTFYYYFRDLPDVLEEVMNSGNVDTLRFCDTAESFSEGIRYYLDDFLRFNPNMRSFLSSSYRSQYERLLTQNCRQVLLHLVGRFFPEVPCNNHEIRCMIEIVACGLSGYIVEHCKEENLDTALISEQTFCLINARLAGYTAH